MILCFNCREPWVWKPSGRFGLAPDNPAKGPGLFGSPISVVVVLPGLGWLNNILTDWCCLPNRGTIFTSHQKPLQPGKVLPFFFFFELLDRKEMLGGLAVGCRKKKHFNFRENRGSGTCSLFCLYLRFLKKKNTKKAFKGRSVWVLGGRGTVVLFGWEICDWFMGYRFLWLTHGFPKHGCFEVLQGIFSGVAPIKNLFFDWSKIVNLINYKKPSFFFLCQQKQSFWVY